MPAIMPQRSDACNTVCSPIGVFIKTNNLVVISQINVPDYKFHGKMQLQWTQSLVVIHSFGMSI
jgi:hypothetical protein